jgi:hypothetical protein
LGNDIAQADKSYIEKSDVGVGPTEELSLRVSVAALAKVVFDHPHQKHPMLALERVAALREDARGHYVAVQAQPFGGALRLRNSARLKELIGDFHFDSERSRSEQDFRIQIRPSNWSAVKRLILRQIGDRGDTILETSPDRELVEEFTDALDIAITPDQYRADLTGLVVENEPTLTDNVHATGSLTTRIYFVFQVRIADPSLVAAILAGSERYSDQDLRRLALQDATRGGKGRANGMLALPLTSVVAAYQDLPAQERNRRTAIEGHLLDENVPAVLEEVSAPRFQTLSGATIDPQAWQQNALSKARPQRTAPACWLAAASCRRFGRQ